MSADIFLFWFLIFITAVSGISVIALKNPIYSALSLAMTMIGVSALFVTLNAYFIAGVQLIVYAGAVMVLFVMVLMLFDLKSDFESSVFKKGISGIFKFLMGGAIAGLIIGSIVSSWSLLQNVGSEQNLLLKGEDTTKVLGQLLFSDYILGFEMLGVLLLVIAIGAVALARSKGGTHDKH